MDKFGSHWYNWLLLFLIGLGIGVVIGIVKMIVKMIKFSQIQHLIRREFGQVEKAFKMKSGTTPILKLLNSLTYLPQMEGFHSVKTLLAHRHRKRAQKRMSEMCKDWELRRCPIAETIKIIKPKETPKSTRGYGLISGTKI